MGTRLTERDERLLVKLAQCLWLTTAQIKRLYFPDGTLNAVQKRLRKLADDGYLRSHREHPTAEAVHAVGPKGKAAVEDKGVEAVLSSETPQHLEHMSGVNEIRIAAETSSIGVAWFFSYWELPQLGWMHAVIPDAVFAARAPTRRSFVVEYDRATETLSKLLEKVRAYAHGIPAFAFEAVLVATERPRRIDLLSRGLRAGRPTLTVLATPITAIAEQGFASAEWVDVNDGTTRRIFDPARKDV